jgi:ACS family hexuronate transporter-like MFS transporter
MDRLTLNITVKPVMATFNLDERGYGQLESAFAIAFAIGSITFGWLADRFNVRWLYPGALVAWSAAGLCGGLAGSFYQLLFCRFMLGLFEGANWPCALRTTQRILPPEQRAMGNGIFQSGTAVGSVATPLLVHLLVREGDESWRVVFMAVGVLGVLWAVLWLPSIRSAELALPQPSPGPALMPIVGWLVLLLAIDLVAHFSSIATDWPRAPLIVKFAVTVLGIAGVYLWLRRATANDDGTLPPRLFLRRFWVLMVLVVTINVTWHFLRAWLPLFLQNQRGYDLAEVSNFFIVYYIAADVGSLSAGLLTLLLVAWGWSVFGSRVLVFALFVALELATLFIPNLAGPALVALLILVGYASLGLYPVYYASTQELTTRHQGKVTGCLGCITWLIMSLLQEAVGEWVKETQSYTAGFALAALAPVAGLIALLFFWKPIRVPPTPGFPPAGHRGTP